MLSRVLAGEGEDKENEGEKIANSESFRIMVRMLTLHAADKYSEVEWKELVGLRGHGSVPLNRALRHVKVLLSKYEIGKWPKDELDRLFRAVSVFS